MTEMQMYWLLKLDDISSAACLFATICGILFLVIMIICACGYSEFDNHEKKIAYKTSRNSFIVFIIFLIPAILIPNTKQMALIMVTPKIANNEQVKQIPDKLLDLANEWLDELKPNKTEDK